MPARRLVWRMTRFYFDGDDLFAFSNQVIGLSGQTEAFIKKRLLDLHPLA